MSSSVLLNVVSVNCLSGIRKCQFLPRKESALKSKSHSFKRSDVFHLKKSSKLFQNENVFLKYSNASNTKHNHAIYSSAEFEALKGITIYKASTGEAVELVSLWTNEENKIAVVPFLTHFADLSSWEYAQKLTKKVIPYLNERPFLFAAVGLGSVENARKFSETLSFPIDQLYADPEGECYEALKFSPGFGQDIPINPYLKLLPMLMGIGSPGTIQEVLRGYVGDRNAKEVYSSSLFDVLGKDYQRPFELATLRLFNMAGILPKWAELSPPKSELLTQQGGTVVFEGETTVFRYNDTGILKYTDVDFLLERLESLS